MKALGPPPTNGSPVSVFISTTRTAGAGSDIRRPEASAFIGPDSSKSRITASCTSFDLNGLSDRDVLRFAPPSAADAAAAANAAAVFLASEVGVVSTPAAASSS